MGKNLCTLGTIILLLYLPNEELPRRMMAFKINHILKFSISQTNLTLTFLQPFRTVENVLSDSYGTFQYRNRSKVTLKILTFAGSMFWGKKVPWKEKRQTIFWAKTYPKLLFNLDTGFSWVHDQHAWFYVCNLTLFSLVYFLTTASTEISYNYIFTKLDLKFEENVFCHSIIAVFSIS